MLHKADLLLKDVTLKYLSYGPGESNPKPKGSSRSHQSRTIMLMKQGCLTVDIIHIVSYSPSKVNFVSNFVGQGCQFAMTPEQLVTFNRWAQKVTRCSVKKHVCRTCWSNTGHPGSYSAVPLTRPTFRSLSGRETERTGRKRNETGPDRNGLFLMFK